MTSESQVAAERAVNIVGAEAKLVAAERAIGLTSESQVEFNVVAAAVAAKLGKDHRESECEPELNVAAAEVVFKLGKDLWESEFEFELNVVAAEVAAQFGTDQWESEFEHELNVVAAEVAAKLGFGADEEVLQRSVSESHRVQKLQNSYVVPKLWWVYIGLLILSTHCNCFHGPGQLALYFYRGSSYVSHMGL